MNAQSTWVGEARDEFLERNGFTTEAYSAATVKIPIGPLVLALPNTAGRKKLAALHDLHHVATGYGTDLVGEGEIGAWELRAGCNNLAGVVYNGMAAMLAILLSPRRVLRAFRSARGANTLYRLGYGRDDIDELLECELVEFRARLGIPEGGLAEGRQGLHSAAPETTK